LLLKDFIPSPQVSEFVQLYRIVHLVFEAGQVMPFKAYPPRPEHCLAFYPFDTEKVQFTRSGKTIEHLPVVLYGQQLEVTNRFIGNHFLVFQIIFQPGALYRLTGMPSSELTNEYIDGESVFCSDLRLVNEQLFHAKNYDTMIAVAEQFVLQLIKTQRKSPHLLDETCKLLLAAEGNRSIDWLAKTSCLSNKQLERKCKERIGINPKLYARITRFDKAFRLKNSKPDFDWLRIAVECNYHDYQHLVKDYKDFTGWSPASFHAIEDKAPERAFGLNEGYYQNSRPSSDR
jgi:AraC-like DNA-binding protein